jgi:hypothetical protein
MLISWVLGEVPEDRLADIAWEMMETGLDSPSLRTLTGLTQTGELELGALFNDALRELGLGPLSVAQALLERAKDIAAAITEGAINPFEGAYRIWLLRRDQGGPDVLEPFGKILKQDLEEVDELLRRQNSVGIDQLRARRTEIDRRFEGLIVSEARHLVGTGAA